MAPTTKRLEGRDEPILDPGIPIIDAHHHLYVRPGLRYLFDDYLADARAGHNIIASVYVETQDFMRPYGPDVLRSLGEIEYANGAAAMAASGVYGDCLACAAIIGYADFRHGDAVAELFDRALDLTPGRLRGFRQITMENPSEAPFRHMVKPLPKGVLQHPLFRSGFSQLAPRGLSFDASIFHNQLPDIIALADSFPGTTIVLDHMGMAMGMEMNEADRAEVFRVWRDSLRELARRPNVLCKVGGLGMPLWGLRFEHRDDPVGYRELADAWKPYVDVALEAFGFERSMAESNFPPDGRSCGYVPLWNALKHIVQGCSQDEKAALFHGTAARVYRIEMAAETSTAV